MSVALVKNPSASIFGALAASRTGRAKWVSLGATTAPRRTMTGSPGKSMIVDSLPVGSTCGDAGPGDSAAVVSDFGAAPGHIRLAIKAALALMKEGKLVSDETVLNLIRERAGCMKCSGGFLLDGFPRTIAQAEALDLLLSEQNVRLSVVFNYELPIETIIARISGRRTCSNCKAVYNVATRPSRVPGVCDHCGGKLVQREDDQPEAVRVRLAAYAASTRPLIDYYKKQKLLVTIQAEGTPEEIYQRTRLLALTL